MLVLVHPLLLVAFGEALIATASGLCVAIMAFIVYTFFSHRLDSIINQIEGMCVNIVSAKREGWN